MKIICCTCERTKDESEFRPSAQAGIHCKRCRQCEEERGKHEMDRAESSPIPGYCSSCKGFISSDQQMAPPEPRPTELERIGDGFIWRDWFYHQKCFDSFQKLRGVGMTLQTRSPSRIASIEGEYRVGDGKEYR